jgi:hypothetical protein
MFQMTTCLCTYSMVLDGSSYYVVCLDYECLLSWIKSVFYIVCRSLVFNSCNILNIGLQTSICASVMCNLLLLTLYTVKPVLNGISRVQNIFLLKPGFRLIKVYYNN